MKKFIKQRLLEGIENTLKPFSLEYFKYRIPFLKDYNVIVSPSTTPHPEVPDMIEMRVETYNTNIKVMGTDKELHIFPQVNAFSRFNFSTRKVRGTTLININLQNEVLSIPPNDMEPITRNVLLMAQKMQNEKMSSRNEIFHYEGKELPTDEIDKAINDINRKLFELEEYLSKINIKIF